MNVPKLNGELQDAADKLLNGDHLNVPLMHKADMERVLYYCIANLAMRIEALETAPKQTSFFGKEKHGKASSRTR